MRISDWSSDVCSSDLEVAVAVRSQIADLLRICPPGSLPQPIVDRIKPGIEQLGRQTKSLLLDEVKAQSSRIVETLEAEGAPRKLVLKVDRKSHTSELQSLMRISYAVFCLTKKKNTTTTRIRRYNHDN